MPLLKNCQLNALLKGRKDELVGDSVGAFVLPLYDLDETTQDQRVGGIDLKRRGTRPATAKIAPTKTSHDDVLANAVTTERDVGNAFRPCLECNSHRTTIPFVFPADNHRPRFRTKTASAISSHVEHVPTSKLPIFIISISFFFSLESNFGVF